MKRNPHPARRSRFATLGISTSAFVSIVSGLVWNTHQAELVANVTDANSALVEQVTSVPGSTTPEATVGGSVNPAATIAPTAPSAPATKSATTAPSTTTVEPATPSNTAVTPAAPATAPAPAVVSPAAPAPAAVYTCMSPGGKTENPSSSGSCPNAKYGYALTQI